MVVRCEAFSGLLPPKGARSKSGQLFADFLRCAERDLEAELTVALELRFAEELVDCALVRKSWVSCCVAQDIFGFVAVDRCLDVDQRACVADARVMDRPNGAIRRRT